MCERVCASEKVKEGIPRGNSKTKKELKKLDADRRYAYLVCVYTQSICIPLVRYIH